MVAFYGMMLDLFSLPASYMGANTKICWVDVTSNECVHGNGTWCHRHTLVAIFIREWIQAKYVVLDNCLENILDWMNVSYIRVQTTYKEPLATVTIA
jgi:hypothetical protein